MSGGGSGGGGGRRKRERSAGDEPEDQEFMPLSKRITCLNLNPGAAGAEDKTKSGGAGGGPNANSNGHHNSASQGSDGQQSDNSSLSDSQSSSPSQSDYTRIYTPGSHYDVANNGLFELDEEMSSDGGVILLNGQSQNLFQNPHDVNGMGGHGVSAVGPEGQVQLVSTQNPELYGGFEPQSFPYDPSLDQRANPYYYEQNRHLYDLYLQRIHRTNVAPHPYVLRFQQPNQY